MQEQLKVVLIQSDLIWENPKANRILFSEKMESITDKVDLIVLPEMFTTGFTMNASHVYEDMDGQTIQWMLEMADKFKVAISGSIIISEEGRYFNRLLFVEPSGKITKYDKRHTFTLAGEEKVYTRGEEKVIVNYKGWKICPLICYDLRFPVWARNVEHYDILIYVANWPKPRISAWDALLKARAIENMCYCIGLNRVGVDGLGIAYNGHSAIYDVLGNEIATTTSEKEQIEIATLEKQHVKKYRNALKFLNDKDDFNLIQN